MFLKSLEMQGFKSFPDKTVLAFGKGITAVVGPNGSGKSNISDAVRWVLGEKSSRSLRGSKMEDVIFSGTQGRRAQGFAQVTLRLDNSDRGISSYDKEEIAVTRRYYRSGNSEYLINGENVRLKDIEELFMDTGLGSDGYSMVGQGRIESIISSKSADRREMFDEASGIAHFRSRRTDAQRRLSQAEENLVRLRDIMAELESRVGPLKEQSEKAEQFLVLAQEKKELEIGLLLSTAERAKGELSGSEEKLSIAAAQHEQADRELSEIEKKIEDSIALTQSLNGKIDEIRRDSAHIDEEIARLESLAAVDQNSIAHNEEAIDRIRRDQASANDTRGEINSQIATAQAELAQLEASLEQKRMELATLSETVSGAKTEDEGLNGQIAALTKEISALSLAVSDARIQLTGSETATREIYARMEEITATLTGHEKTARLLMERREQYEQALRKTEEEIEEASNALNGYRLMLEKKREKARKAQATRDEVSIKLRQVQARAKMLDDMQKNMEGYSGSVKAVMKQTQRGALTGIHGALTQLITVPDKYAAAIETALGAAVQNIVTENEADAKRAIYYLKENKLGRATFLPLSAVRGRSLTESGLEHCTGFVEIANNLITYDAKYSGVVASLLGRTVVAEDMDAAIAIAKRYSYRFKIVTLDGQVINAGGSMTGGSRAHSAGILSRANELEKLAEEIRAAQARLAQSEEELRTAQEDARKCEAGFDGAQAQQQNANEEKIRRESDLALIDSQLAAANSTLAGLRSEQEGLRARLLELEQGAGQANAQIDSLTQQLAQKEQEMERLSAGREELSRRRESLNEKISALNMELLAIHKDMQARRETIDDLTRRLTLHADRLGALDEEIAQIVQKNEALAAGIAAYREQAGQLRTRGSGTKEEIDRLLVEREQEEQRGSKLRLLERAKSGERERLSGELARLEEKKTAIRKEYDEAVAKLFDEYQLTRREAQEVAEPITDRPEAQRRLAELKGRIRTLGNVNVGAIEEYKEVAERYVFMKTQIGDVETSRDEINRLIAELTEKMGEQFLAQFDKINTHFSETFVQLFGGGNAKLLLDDPSDPLECGIEIEVQPPGKNVQNIDLFSGGEKGLAGVALLFAILRVKPAPFCVFDEVEAALDDVNVSRYAQYVRRMTDKSQFILITHRRGTMEEADTLYGVTMQEKGVSKLLELHTAEMVEKLGIKE